MFKKYLLLGFFWVTALALHAQDTTYFVNGSISTITTSWKQGKQAVYLYNLEGLNTLAFMRTEGSYFVNITPVYGKNGSVSALVETIHPGGSPCSMVTTYRFNGTNEPLLKIIEYGTGPLCNQERETWFWNKKSKGWVKQETVSCMPVEDD